MERLELEVMKITPPQRYMELGRLASEMAHDFANTLTVVAQMIGELREHEHEREGLVAGTAPVAAEGQPWQGQRQGQWEAHLSQLEVLSEYASGLVRDLLMQVLNPKSEVAAPPPLELHQLLVEKLPLLELFAGPTYPLATRFVLKNGSGKGNGRGGSYYDSNRSDRLPLALPYLPLPVVARPLDLLRILTNLISNATQALSLSLSQVKRPDYHPQLELSTQLAAAPSAADLARGVWLVQLQPAPLKEASRLTDSPSPLASPSVCAAAGYATLALSDNGPGLTPALAKALISSQKIGEREAVEAEVAVGAENQSVLAHTQTEAPAASQGEVRLTTRSSGLGLGLAGIKALAQANGWGLQLESIPNQRTCFTLWLPLASTDSAPPALTTSEEANQHCPSAALLFSC